MTDKLDTLVKSARASHGTVLADDYSRGMINGLILAQAMIADEEPRYVSVAGQPSTAQVDLQNRIDSVTAR